MTMRTVITFLSAVLAMLSGCDPGVVTQPQMASFSASEAHDVRTSIDQWVGSEGQALFLCGQSDGLGVFAEAWKEGFTSDGMSGGRIAFIIRSDGRADVIFRDATGSYASSLDETGDVTRINDGQAESWVVTYDRTGITETHNIVLIDDRLVDLWTSNKPQSVIGASAKLFRAPCVRA